MDQGNQDYLQLIKKAMSARAKSRSPKRDLSPGSPMVKGSGSPSRSGRTTKSGKSGEDRSKSRSKSPSKSGAGSRASSAVSRSTTDSAMTAGKASSATTRRVTVKSADITARGLKTVDQSGQGMTQVQPSLFNRRDIGILDLSSNNLRTLPVDVRKLTNLVHLDLSRNGIRCSTSSDYVGLPKDLGKLDSLEVLIISECNLPFIPPAIWLCAHLKVLDISRNKINLLLPEVGNLERLQHLNAQQTSITTLPPEIAFCQDLEEVLLWGNTIESLPETMKELPKLKYLAINYRSFCSIVDSYMENLLQSGQIQSEFIPPVLFDMPALDILDLEETKINTLPDHCVGKLKEFYLARNFFQEMPPVVMTMDMLDHLDISDNQITEIPEGIGNLCNVKVLKMNNNKITKLPNTIGNLNSLVEFALGGNALTWLPKEIGDITHLRTLVLERNQIKAIPESITNLEELETLDLTSNCLMTLPMNFYKMKKLKAAHTYQKFHKHGLWLHLNPLKTPPQEVWKTDQPEKIYGYLRMLQIKKTENLQRQKLFFLGEAQCGKTSLMNTMTMGKTVLTKGMEDSTPMVEFIPWKTENDVEFLIYDLGGEEIYKHTHYMFLDPKGMYLVVYDHRKYTPQNHYRALGYWLDLLNLYVPGAVVKIIGTQSDQCNQDFVEKITEQVQEQLKLQLESRQLKIDDEMKKINAALQLQLPDAQKDIFRRQKRRLLLLKNTGLKITGDVSVVSSSEGIRGINELVHEIELMAVDKTLFPHAQRFIPEAWHKFRLAIKTRKDLCLSFEEVSKIAIKFNLTKDAIPEILTFFHGVGEIMWFRNTPALNETIFHKPRNLVAILKGMFRHDLGNYLDFDNNRVFASKGQMSRDMFNQSVESFIAKGQISRSLLLCLWFYLQLGYDDFNFLLELVPKLDLSYTVPQPNLPLQRSEYVPLMVIPSFNRETAEEDLSDLWPEAAEAGMEELGFTITFPLLYPDGLFEKMSCRLQQYFDFRFEWQDTVYGDLESGSVLMRRVLNPETYDCVLQLTLRSPDLKELSQVFSDLCKELRNLMESYHGLTWHVEAERNGEILPATDTSFPTELYGL